MIRMWSYALVLAVVLSRGLEKKITLIFRRYVILVAQRQQTISKVKIGLVKEATSLGRNLLLFRNFYIQTSRVVTVVPGFVRPTMQTHPELKHVAPFSFTLLFTICRVKQNTKTLWFSEFLFLVNGVTIHLFSQARNLGIILNSFLSSFSYSVTNIDCSLSDISSVYLIFILCITRVGLHYLSLGLSKQPHNQSFLLLLTSSVLYSTSSVICL